MPIEPLSAPLLRWYDANARDLPWRRTTSPWRTLLSELMLQQTRVDTVVPYFERFVARWPTVEAFAAADEADVLGAWAGLGYYSRARNLLAAAREATRLGGLPADPQALRSLPGIGPYTAGAVASIAHGVRTPVVDGNVERVLSRLFAIELDVRSKAGKARLWSLADDLVPADRPGDYNQALMELGATVCSPKAPRCGACPLAETCEAKRIGRVLDFPIKPKKAAPRPVRGVSLLVRRGGDTLLVKRPETGLLAGLWEPPILDERPAGEPETTAVGLLSARLGIRPPGEPRGEVTHVFTHRRLVLAVYAGNCMDDVSVPEPYVTRQWWNGDPEHAPALSKLARRILALDNVEQTGLFEKFAPRG